MTFEALKSPCLVPSSGCLVSLPQSPFNPGTSCVCGVPMHTRLNCCQSTSCWFDNKDKTQTQTFLPQKPCLWLTPPYQDANVAAQRFQGKPGLVIKVAAGSPSWAPKTVTVC